MNLRVNLAPSRPDGFVLQNPVIMASGTFGYGVEYRDLVDVEALGAIVAKAVAPEPRAGNPMPRLFETPAGLLNSIGLQGVGVEAFIRDKCPVWADWRTPVIANVVGESIDAFASVAEQLEGAPGVAALELNISCPNVAHGLDFGADPRIAAKLTAAVRRRATLPLLVKLTPNCADVVAVAEAVAECGADALTVANTWLGMAIDVKARRPVFAGTYAGLSGPAIRPLALRLVYQVAQRVRVPVIGSGGIATTNDALEFIMAGATAVQIGTATFTEPTAATSIVQGIRQFLQSEGVHDVTDLIGVANALPARQSEAQ